MIEYTKLIAESKNFIVLDKYIQEWKVCENVQGYQTENDLEQEFIRDLQNQGYDYLSDLNTPEKMLANVRQQLQGLNKVQFSEGEWMRFVETYLDRPSDTIIDKTRKIHDDYIHDFVFDDGRIQNIYLVDKKTIARNKVQVIRQFEQTGSHANRYDVTVLVNGLPLVQIELKKRGVAIREAFNQVHRYSKGKIAENVEAELVDVCLLEAIDENENIIEVDTTNKSPEEVVEEILDFLNRGIKRRVGIVDWTKVYDEVLPYLKLGGDDEWA